MITWFAQDVTQTSAIDVGINTGNSNSSGIITVASVSLAANTASNRRGQWREKLYVVPSLVSNYPKMFVIMRYFDICLHNYANMDLIGMKYHQLKLVPLDPCR